MSASLERALEFIRHVERFTLDATVANGLLHPAFEQWELPNALNPKGQRSDVADSLRRMALGRRLLVSQRYEVTRTLEADVTAVVEATWSGVMAVDAGPLKKGATLRAYFCMFFELEDGKIRRIRNYDCFEPFGP